MAKRRKTIRETRVEGDILYVSPKRSFKTEGYADTDVSRR